MKLRDIVQWFWKTVERKKIPRYIIPVLHLGNLQGYSFPCPGCRLNHFFPTAISDAEGRRWVFNGNLSHPTFVPSQKIEYDVDGVCHLNVTLGHLDFYDDCTHRLRGRVVPMVEIEE